MRHLFWRCLGARRILTTNLPQYRSVGSYLDLAGSYYRITHTHGWDVWARPMVRVPATANVIVVENPLKHLRSARATPAATRS